MASAAHEARPWLYPDYKKFDGAVKTPARPVLVPLGQMADAVVYVGAGVDTEAKPARYTLCKT